MSATFDSEKFSKYFCYPINEHILNAPIINVNSKVQHQVDVYHLEEISDILQLQDKVFFVYAEQIKIKIGFQNFPVSCEANYTPGMCQLIIELVQHLDQMEDESNSTNRGSVMIFLPGIHEIEDTLEELMLVNE
jgi:HrpA-like RNA helicase